MTEYSQWESAIIDLAKNKGIEELYPEQIEILKKIHETYELEQNIFLLSAPPACGKSILITLVATLLSNEKIAIVVPYTELKIDFQNNVNSENIDIMTLNEYIQCELDYDIVMIDEAHNISNFIEYDSNYVKNMKFYSNTDNYELIATRFLQPQKEFQAGRIHATSTKWIVDNIHLDNRSKYVKLQYNLSEWICFLYISKHYAELKFVHGNTSNNFKKGTKKTYMFSATPLNYDELKFYCNISSEEIGGKFTIPKIRKYENKVKIYEVLNCDMQKNKLKYISKILDEFNEKTLILFKNSINSQAIYEELVNNGYEEIYHIKSGINPIEREKIYNKYESSNRSVLLTASSVFWEGINIKSLKIVILYEVPYPKPNVIDLINNKIDYIKTMRRRIIQGVGRVGRKNKEVGIAVLLFGNNLIKKIIVLNNCEQIPEEMKKHLMDL